MHLRVDIFGLEDLLQFSNGITIQQRMIYKLVNSINPILMHSQSNTEVYSPRSNSIIPINTTMVNPQQLTWPRSWVLTFTLQPSMMDMEINLEIRIKEIGNQVSITLPIPRNLIAKRKIRMDTRPNTLRFNILEKERTNDLDT